MPIFHNDDTVSEIALMSDAQRREWYEMMTPEGKIKAEIRKYLQEQGAYVFSPTQMGYGTQTLDLLVCYKGHFIAIEVKALGKKLTPRQAMIGAEIAAAGGDPWLAYGVDEVKAHLKRYD